MPSMKLSDYAKKLGVKYKTAWLWYSKGIISGYQMPTGTIIVTDQKDTETESEKVVAVYARVSSNEMKSILDAQAERLITYCSAKGWKVTKVVKEIGSGINESRPKFLSILRDKNITTIVVEHKDRASRFGVNYINTLLEIDNRELHVINSAENGKEDILQDLVSIIYSFSARMYGQRKAKRKIEIIAKTLQND